MAPTGYDRSATSASVGLHVRLSSRAIHRLWVLLIAVQCINTIVLLGRAYIYLAYGLNPASFLRVVVAVFLTKDQQQFVHHNYTVIGGSFGVLAFLFIGSTWKTIRASRRSADRQISPTPPPAAPPFRGKPRPMGSFARVQRTVGGVQARILALWVSLGVRGERFEYGFVAREGLEMALQSMQAYSASQLITNTTIVLVAAVLIAISGLVHPLLTRVHHSNEAMRRFVSIVIEFILDFAWVGEYERSRLEIQQIMLLSWPELGLSMFPFVSGLISIRSLRRVLSSASDSRHLIVPEETNVLTNAPEHRPTSGPRSDDSLIAIRTALPSRVVHCCHHVLTLYGLVILAVAIVASTVSRRHIWSQTNRLEADSCVFPLAPWLVSHAACIGLVVNCSKLGISGRAEELVEGLHGVHASTVAYLAVTDCPELEIPPSINLPSEKFTNLVSVVMGQMLAKALHYVVADLSQEDWSIELERRGFDQQQPTLWVLEGLLYYMTKDSIVRCEQQDEGDSDALWSAHALKYGEDDPRQGVLTLLHWPLFVNADLGRRGQFFGRDWTPLHLRLSSSSEDDSGDDVMRWFLVSATKTTSEPTFGPQS
ncbi:hypothetical protein P43SY_007024 [Pythium insidiosum]|uniref:Transmembrane protein n=1 Tax=Pythium insidiosum TaxID=114742 RepID=A0AAD5Q907_PYTIN|nr:hypothetical protein P43SY_007024 [Pythium insidiosum]